MRGNYPRGIQPIEYAAAAFVASLVVWALLAAYFMGINPRCNEVTTITHPVDVVMRRRLPECQ